MYLNCKYGYWRFRKYDVTYMPFLNWLINSYDKDADPAEEVKQNNERLKMRLKHKRYGTPLPPITFLYKPRIVQSLENEVSKMA